VSALERPKREALAQALARGLGAKAAAKAAGYVNTRKGPRLALCDDIAQRVQEIRADPSQAVEPDLDLLERVLKAAIGALRIGTGAGYAAAFRGFELAARLEGRLGRASPAKPEAAAIPTLSDRYANDPELRKLDEDLTTEEWEERYGPLPPGPDSRIMEGEEV